ncbi:protein-associating with the carboxyl-terminal domain of ezrin isoform X1 [Anolis carolinensis]|uniref:SCY1 like pseudokinase 3 n=2 Tax=Anolis carolinensis TaxID=28377 RepID=H9GJC2_ANOCA|nr:PREDICTED: protein-associating with the carboxyl-terminal domain of ezrin [Anolis carolinensis]|eukprot:XP_003225498.1 PREDICTED: protein-associating with the carboxyl-terminal domain of ezrin [Anolis carolinensis]
MGSENSAVKRDALAGHPFTFPSGVNIYPAILPHGKLASVFVYKRENEENVNKAAKHLKTLRHPCLLRFLSCTVETDGIHLITERVQPLEKVLETLSSSEICAGIYDILQVLVFLHDRGNLTHNNICLSSVFVSENGHWKLGGMETVCNQNEATPEFLNSIKAIRDKTGIPPEELCADFQLLPAGQGHSRDAYAFGVIVENLMPFLKEGVAEDVLVSFQQTLYTTLLNSDPMCRGPLSSLLSHEFFRNEFLEMLSFLNSLTLKTEEEKTEFFKFLLDRVCGLSEELIALRLVPLLLNQLVFAEPVAVRSFLPHILSPRKDKVGESQINGLLSPAVFQAHVSPVLLKLFEVHEEHVRIVLLSHLDAYAELFTQKELKNIILPQVLLGLRDTSDSLVAITLQSLGVLVSLLGPDVVVGGDRTKIFKRSAPSFSKTSDFSPDNSLNHVINCQKKLVSQPLQDNSSIFKCPNSGNLSFSNRNHVPRQNSHIALRKGEQDSLHLYNVPGDLHTLKNGGSCKHIAEKTVEEWPDWSECEELETGKSATVKTNRNEFCVSSNSCLTSHDASETSWSETVHSSNFKLSSGSSLHATGFIDITESPDTFELQKEYRTLNSSPSTRSGNNDSYIHRDQNCEIFSLPKTSCTERSPKLECDLGEEFMIQVKRKELHDPELDWFADMVPDIKPSSTFFILPELGPHPVIHSNLDKDYTPVCDAQKMQFSLKFAAPEVSEVNGVGWEEQEELKWEEDANW